MEVSRFAGKLAETSMLVSKPKLITVHFSDALDPSLPGGTACVGHLRYRSSAFDKPFNERHILASVRRFASTAIGRKLMAFYFSAWTDMRSTYRLLPARLKYGWPSGWKT